MENSPNATKSLQELFDQYASQDFDKAWHSIIGNNVVVLSHLRSKAQSEGFKGYESLNNAFKKLVDDNSLDFLDHFLYKKDNGIGSTGNRLLSNNEKSRISDLVKRRPEVIIDILTAKSPKIAFEKTNELFSSNEWIIVHRFVRVLFSEALTAVDSPILFDKLIDILKERFLVRVSGNDFFSKSKEILGLVKGNDPIKIQIFFWYLITRYRDETAQEEKREIDNKTNVVIKHALSTEEDDQILLSKGYSNQGLIGYVHSRKGPNTVPLHQTYIVGEKDYFYYIDRNLESISKYKTSEEKIVGYLSTKVNTVESQFYRFMNDDTYDHFYCTNPDQENLKKLNYFQESKNGFEEVFLLPEPGVTTFPLFVYSTNPEVALFTKIEEPQGSFGLSNLEVKNLIKEYLGSSRKFWWLNTQRNIGQDKRTNPDVARFGETISLENFPNGMSEGELVIANYQGNNDIWGLVQFSEYIIEDKLAWFNLLYELPEIINVSDLKQITGFEKAYNSFVPYKLYELDKDLFIEIINTTELGPIDLDDSAPTESEKIVEDTKGLHNPLVTLAYSDVVKNTEDLLDVGKEIEVFARLLAQKDLSPPLAIALFGNWGSGKSFFMHNLEVMIKQLSDSNTLKEDKSPFYCKEIVHISFNAWSYLDANLWIGFMASIFEKLDEYLTGITKDEKEKLELEEKFVHKLEFVQNQKTRALLKKQNLEKEKEKLESKLKDQERELNEKIEEIKNEKWSSITSAVWEQISNDEIKNNLDQLGITPEVLEKSPSQYVKNSINSFKNYLRQFKSFKLPQIIGSLLILITLILVPILFNWIIESVSNILYTTLPIILGISIKIRAAWKFLKPFADKAINIQSQYVQKLKEKEREHLESLSKLQLEKANKSQEIQDLSDEIEELEDEISDVEYSLKHSLTRMALNNFISERSMSADYQNKLGVISIIRKDLETLSALFINQEIDDRLPQKEQEKLQEKQEELAKIRKQFGERPLERIILYIDDLDRCPDEKVLDVLQAVHLLMAFPLFIVVVGVDKRCVTNALYNREVSKYFRLEEYSKIAKDVESKDKKENTNGIHIIHPDEYLEKIFQIPFQLQKPEPKSIQNMIHKLLEKDILDENKPDSKSEASSLSETSKPEEESKIEDSKAGNSQEENIQLAVQNDENKDENQEPDTPSDSEEKSEVPPDALRIGKAEREYIEKISPLIGSTPRTIKRFINIYRLIRAHQDLSGIDEDKEYLIVIFILAMHLGKYKGIADSLFSVVRGNTHLNLKEILRQNRDEEIQDIYLILNDDKLKRLFTVRGLDIVSYLTFIRRFSFNALEEQLPLVQKSDSPEKNLK